MRWVKGKTRLAATRPGKGQGGRKVGWEQGGPPALSPKIQSKTGSKTLGGLEGEGGGGGEGGESWGLEFEQAGPLAWEGRKSVGRPQSRLGGHKVGWEATKSVGRPQSRLGGHKVGWEATKSVGRPQSRLGGHKVGWEGTKSVGPAESFGQRCNFFFFSDLRVSRKCSVRRTGSCMTD